MCLCLALSTVCICFFFFNDTATTEIYTLSLHDALPISGGVLAGLGTTWVLLMNGVMLGGVAGAFANRGARDRKSTRLNSSHSQISYAVFCLKKKKKNNESDIVQPRHSDSYLSTDSQ